MAPPRTSARGIGVVAVLALVVALAAAVRGPAPLKLPVGVWEHREQNRSILLGMWPDHVQHVVWEQYPTGDLERWRWPYDEDISMGVPVEGAVHPTVRFYERAPIDRARGEDTLGLRFRLREPVSIGLIDGGGDSWMFVKGGHIYPLKRLSPGPKPLRFAIQTSGCLGRCSVFSLEVDAGGHVRYEGFHNISPIGRFASNGGAQLFRAMERTAALARPDSITYRCGGCDGQFVDLVVDYENGRRVSQSVMLDCRSYDLFVLEAYRLLPTLALIPVAGQVER